ncbi:MAG: Na(+)-translocating NADH-quinone reductase subunit A [Oceanicoccus sp.]|uniref:Na(+)-translocating NADH-quinone reductase subunit A n=1 Tax=Oceanicoccus sp. TaxID=2691044 RepID=UPI002630FF69|nr:Na(+)-translocating NADH-quinone reductase subunit A [Oceanicoccus sp.]MCP3907902.1 Na(+)-translocating NADH-quinone reductase subunit A [Oceanicoccus sp.]MDG1773283.1 Na(+)-translocating NADH-quinone reductase subunit A [Oceanicoccus sp.]
MIKISRGLDLPISGAPVQVISEGAKTRSVALVGFDYVGMKPTMSVQVGDRVKTGQLLFTDKKTEGVKYTSPATGIVSAINRGDKRVFQSVVIDVEEDEFETFASGDVNAMDRQQVVDTLVNSGQWTALRTRPYSRVPAPDSTAAAIFVTAIDTHPLAADPSVIIAEQVAAFEGGLNALSKLSDKVFVSTAPGANISTGAAKVEAVEFAGPHPAGLAGTHMHYLNPVSANKIAWSIGYQDVIAIGKLFAEGKLSVERVVALAGPQVDKPELVRTRLGANLQELTAGKVKPENNRVISGSVLGGRTARGAVAYLGRYHQQVSVLLEGDEREFMGWMSPGVARHSNLAIYISQFTKSKLLDFTTSTNGSERAMVPVGSYEKIMPLDILPTQLLRSLIVGDTAMAQDLGCLELDEEDLALCTYVCSGKYEYGPILRDNLTRIEKEG